MFDFDLAVLYGVETKQLKRAVKRNIARFPEDFMIELTLEELGNLRCQIGTSSWGGVRYRPFAFTEQGVAMLSTVLNSERAIQVNIAIMRAFVKLREILLTHRELAFQFKELERKVDKHDGEIQAIFKAIQRLMAEPEKPKGKFGFHP